MAARALELRLRVSPMEALSRLMRHPSVNSVGLADPLGPPTRIAAEVPRSMPTREREPLDAGPFEVGDFELRPRGDSLLLVPVGTRLGLRPGVAVVELDDPADGRGARVRARFRRFGPPEDALERAVHGVVMAGIVLTAPLHSPMETLYGVGWAIGAPLRALSRRGVSRPDESPRAQVGVAELLVEVFEPVRADRSSDPFRA